MQCSYFSLGNQILVASCFLVAQTEISKLPLYFTPSSISDEIVETLSSKGVILENKTIHTPPRLPTIQNWGVVVFYRQLKLQQHNIAWRGYLGMENFIVSFLSWQTVREALQSKMSQLILLPIVGQMIYKFTNDGNDKNVYIKLSTVNIKV